MRYRKLGRLDWEVSAISMGVLQISAAANDPDEIDTEARIAAIRCAIDNGVNYINLGFPFYFKKPAERCAYIRKALSNGYREKVKLAVNIPALLVHSPQDMERYLDKQLKWFSLDNVDFCQIEGVNRGTWSKLEGIDARTWLDNMRVSRKVDHFGFTFHDDSRFLKQVCDYDDTWATVQFDYSIMDVKHHAGASGLKIAADKGLSIIAADGLKGGRLDVNIPEPVQKIWDKAGTKRTPAQWSIRWLLNHGSLSTIQVEFQTPEQAKEYIKYADTCEHDMLDIFEKMQANCVRDAYHSTRLIPCTGCRCCMPCPHNIDVPRIVELYNDALMYGDRRIPQFLYHLEGHRNTRCKRCASCQNNCPRHYPLIEILDKAAQLFDER